MGPSDVLACPESGDRIAAYDHRTRRWRHLDTCQYKTIIEAKVPRGQCSQHGVRQIGLPWAEPYSRFTALFEALVIDWLRETSQRAVARRMGLTWAEGHGIMERAVRRGVERRGEEVIEYLGVDEKSFQKDHEYVTVVCDLGAPRVLDAGDGRGRARLDQFYERQSEEQLAGTRAIVMHMWGPYISSTLDHVPGTAEKIVFDTFHVVPHLKEGDRRRTRVRAQAAQGARRRDAHGHEVPVAEEQASLRSRRVRRLRGVAQERPVHRRAWASMELFSRFWHYRSLAWARELFERWYAWAIRSRLEPIKKVARMIKVHLPNILTRLRHRVTNAATEGINAKIQRIKATGRGYTNRENFRTAILVHCGGLDLHPDKMR